VTVTAALLAAELGEKTIWNPTILGVLVVLSAIGLFCGSVYLLLATNLGARLGFLVSAASLMGFLVLLGILWMTTSTPLNSPKGLEAEWVPKEVVTNPADSENRTVSDIEERGDRISTADLANVRPAVDAALLIPEANAVDEHGEPIEASEFASFNESSEFILGEQDLRAFEIGGGTKYVFWHHPRYAAVEFCTAAEAEPAADGTVPPAECDPLVETQWMILERDLGSIRQPPVFYSIAFVILFALTLLGLHWYEKDQRARKAAGLAPVKA
jgi:hypothetical protein